ncbi:MAG: flagellar motor stator protein MotA [Calditerrivibrio sp.]|nr:flagellar motor stator protein MotA [Calditerrivibrio sp.]MCA1932047.1 flagellar motor stator protein MotA [Calditerrivibrio sp.]
MTAIIGYIVVIGSILGGYLIAGGNLHMLIQPSEFIIIGGAALGALIVGSPPALIKLIINGVKSFLTGKTPSKKEYEDLLMLLYELFLKARKNGLLSLESDVENAKESPIFNNYPTVIKNHHLLHFISDNLKVILTGVMQPHELENLMEVDIETSHKEEHMPGHSIQNMADGLPAFGIVAAVMGVVITMGLISEPPEVLGHHIGAALVGTFLGVLLAYGIVGPIATALNNQVTLNAFVFRVVKEALVFFVNTPDPKAAIELARRAVPPSTRPSFEELEEKLKNIK